MRRIVVRRVPLLVVVTVEPPVPGVTSLALTEVQSAPTVGMRNWMWSATEPDGPLLIIV